jgi:hypothetical protein
VPRAHRVTALLGATLLFACLPVDSRPAPGALHVSVHGNEALAQGIPLTSDGWSVVYDRFLVTIGQTWLSGEACDVYSEADYTRIVDARRSEPQKLSLLYGDGRCALMFAVTSPDEDTLLTAGVSEGDKTFLRQPGAANGGISMRVEGRATDGVRFKHFGWSFFRYSGYDCTFQEEMPFALSGAKDTHATISLRGEALFELDRQPDRDLALGPLRFTPFAQADDVFGDGNGEITTEELEATPSSDPVTYDSLRIQLDSSLFPSLPELEQKPCRALVLNERPPHAD